MVSQVFCQNEPTYIHICFPWLSPPFPSFCIILTGIVKGVTVTLGFISRGIHSQVTLMPAQGRLVNLMNQYISLIWFLSLLVNV